MTQFKKSAGWMISFTFFVLQINTSVSALGVSIQGGAFVGSERLVPGDSYGIFSVGEPLRFTFRSDDSSYAGRRYALQVTDWQQKVLWQSEMTTPSSDSDEEQILLPVELSTPGFYVLTVTEQGVAEPATHRSTFLVLDGTLGTASDPFFASSAFRVKPFLAEAMNKIGIGSILVNIPWWTVEVTPGQFNWTDVDAEIQAYRDAGLRVVAMMQVHAQKDRSWVLPAWERNRIEQAGLSGYGHDELHFENIDVFTKEAVQHLLGVVDSWYLMQEIDIPMRAEWEAPMQYYVRRVNHFIGAAQSVSPNIKICGVGVAPPDTKRGYQAALDIWEQLDPGLTAFGPHIYPSPRSIGRGRSVEIPESFQVQLLEQALDAVSPYGIDELINSEWGYEILAGVDAVYSEDAIQMAKLTARGMILMRAFPKLKMLAYFTMFQTHGDSKGLGGYGLWEVEGGGSLDRFRALNASDRLIPRPALGSFAVVARLLAFPQAMRPLTLPDEVYGYLFQTGERSIIPVWTTRDQTVLHCTLPADVSLVDMMGQDAGMLPAGEQALTLTDAPLYLITAPEQGEAVAQAVEQARNELPPVTLYSRLAGAQQAEVHVRNKQPEEITCRVQLALQGFAEQEQSVQLESLGQTTVRFSLPDQAADQIAGDGLLCEVTAVADTYEESVRFSRFLQTKTIHRREAPPAIDGNLDDHRPFPPVEVKGRDFLFPPDALAARQWIDDQDASFSAWATWDTEALYLAFDILDDVFIQETLPSRFWEQDHIAVAVDTRNNAFPGQGPDQDDFELTTSIHPDTNELAVFVHRAPDGSSLRSNSIADIDAAVQRHENGMFIEMKITWDQLMLAQPQPGQILPVTFAYGDSDFPGRPKPYWMQLTPGIHGGKSPADYQPFVFGQ